MRNQYKVLQEKYELQVEVPTREEKAIYNTKALTQDFVPTAIKIYRTQVEPIIRSWPDFDIMTDIKFPHNILINASGYQGAAIRNTAYWAHIYLYKPQDYPRNDVDAILERWFVHNLFERVYKGYQSDSPKSFYKDVQTGRIPPQKSNADFIQYLIKLAVAKMKTMYNINHNKATSSGDLENWKKAQAIHQKGSELTGGGWNPGDVLGEQNNTNSNQQDPEEIVAQITHRAKVATQGFIKLLNNRKVPGILLANYVKHNINPIIQEIASYANKASPQEKNQLTQYLKDLLETNWLVIDRVYWDIEMDTIVRGAVEDGKVMVQGLQQTARRGNKIISKY